MTISLEAISFNHDPVSATRDAFTIRKNQIADVTLPEWKRGTTLPADSPALYTIGQLSENRLTIKAQFSRQTADPSDVQVHAVGRSGNVLGDVKSRNISFKNGLSEFELFELDSPQPNPGVGVCDIVWDWFVGGTFLQTTEHRIYTIVKAPEAPWGQQGSSFPGFQLPWTEVLEHSCRQATGARDEDEATAKLTRWVNALGQSKLKYDDQGGGCSRFTIGNMSVFKCTSFLDALNNGHGTRETVNCNDCATILSSFANILGCELQQSRIGFEFKTNLIQKIGSVVPAEQPFKFHEVAWKFPASGSPAVFDCCLQLDGDNDLTDDNFSPILGINLPMGVPTGTGYLGRLIKDTPRGRACREWRNTRIQRKIDDGGILRRVGIEPTQLRVLSDEYEFPSWQGPQPSDSKCACGQGRHEVVASDGPSTSDQSLFLKNYSFNKGQQSPAGWKAGEVKSYEAEPDPLHVTEVVWSSNGCSGVALRVLTYECSSLTSARSFLLASLAEFQLPGIKRRLDFVVGGKQVTIGDVAFAGTDELVLLFARANNVILIQNVGRTLVSVSQFAHELDADMTSDLDLSTGPMTEMEQINNSDKQVRVGDEILIPGQAGLITKEKETLFKFFAPAGHVFLRGDDLLYRPLAAGEQFITILALKAGGETARQVLKLYAESSASPQETECCKLDQCNNDKESIMPNITGVWSSIRPTNNGEGSADMTVDGYIEIKRQDPLTGAVMGFYRDPEPRSTTELVTGKIVSENSRSFIKLSHPLGDGFTRSYEGELVATDGEVAWGVQIFAGQYTDRPDSAPSPLPASAAGAPVSIAASDSGQDNGTWVATKP